MKRLLLIILSIFTLTVCHAKYFNAPITIKQNNDEFPFLDNATVTEIFKDSRGFMWFATDRGLICYGGVTAREFRYNLGRHNIRHIEEAFGEIFFIFDHSGAIGCFDRVNERFIPVEFENNLIEGNFNYYTFNPKSGLYAANSNGLYAIDHRIVDRGKNGKMVLIPRRVEQVNMSLHQSDSDNDGNIYSIERETLDVIRYNPTTGAIKVFSTNIKTPNSVRNAYRFFVFDDTFWFTYYWNGMICYDMKEDKHITFSPNDRQNQLNIDYAEITKIEKLDDKTYCFASRNGVVNLAFASRPAEADYVVQFSPYKNDLSGNYIEPRTTALLADTVRRILWTGTYGGGVVKYGDAIDSQLKIPGGQLFSVTEDKRGYIWLTTAREGVMRSDQPRLDDNTTFSAWLPPGMDRQRYRMYNDGDRYIWFGDNSGNIIRVDQYDEKIASFLVSLDGKTPYPTRINGMTLDSRGHLWIASNNRLLRWDQRSDRFEIIDIEGLPMTRISHVLEDRQGKIWLGTNAGLFMVEEIDQTLRAFGGYEKMVGSDGSEVYALDVNGKGDIIATYSDKLLRIGSLDKRSVELYFNVDDGTLPSGHILKVLDDKYGNTWFGNSTRIMTIKSGGSNMFTYSMSTNNRDGCRLRDGRLVWTAAEGLTYFNPEDAYREEAAAKFIISRLKIHGKDVFAGDIIDGVEILDRSINEVKKLIFREGQADFQLFVSDLSFTPFQKQILYKLEPIMTEWRTHSAENGITFPGLKAGEYKLHIKPLYMNESQGEEQIFDIEVVPEWQNSSLTKVSFLIVFAIGLWWIFNFSRRRWQEFKRQQVHRVFEAMNSKTDHDVITRESSSDEEQLLKMLVIGDDRELTNKLTEIFTNEFDVRHSDNSGDGLIDALFHLPRVIICLYTMPGAIECCAKMKNNERTSTIPFIFIDTVDNAANRVSAVEARADDYITYDGADGQMIRQVVDNRVAGHDALHQIYSRILVERGGQESEAIDPEKNSATLFVRSVNETIEQNLKDPGFSVKRLSELMGMSQSTLYRKLLSASGKTVIEAIRDARLRRAAELLYEGRLTIQAISEEIGYLDVATFRKHFVDLYGVNPSRFAKQG